MRDFTFNTGRLYGEDGQPIRIRQKSEDTYAFIDYNRMIIGNVVVPNGEGMSDARLSQVILSLYDHNDYTQDY